MLIYCVLILLVKSHFHLSHEFILFIVVKVLKRLVFLLILHPDAVHEGSLDAGILK